MDKNTAIRHMQERKWNAEYKDKGQWKTSFTVPVNFERADHDCYKFHQERVKCRIVLQYSMGGKTVQLSNKFSKREIIELGEVIDEYGNEIDWD